MQAKKLSKLTQKKNYKLSWKIVATETKNKTRCRNMPFMLKRKVSNNMKINIGIQRYLHKQNN